MDSFVSMDVAPSFGVDDRVVGSLLACVIAADLAHPDGADEEFAEWLATPPDDSESPWDLRSPDRPLDYSPNAVQRATIIAEKIFSAQREEHDSAYLGDGCLPGRFPPIYGAMKLAPLPFVEAVLDELTAMSPQSSTPLPALSSLRGLAVEKIVMLAARAGASMFPPDWWMAGSLGDPQIRGALIRRAAATIGTESPRDAASTYGPRFLSRAAASRSAEDPVEHPTGGVWFGNPLNVLDVSDKVAALVTLGDVPAGIASRDIEIEIPLPWMSDGFDSPAAGEGDLWLHWRVPEYVEPTCPPAHLMDSDAEEELRETALSSAVAMIEQLRFPGQEILVVGDWSGAWLPELWDRLSGKTDVSTDAYKTMGTGIGPLGAYRWKPRSGWLMHAGPATPQSLVSTWTVRSEEGAAFYGVSVDDQVTFADRVAALARGAEPPAQMRELLKFQRSFVKARAQGDHRAAAAHQAEFNRVMRIVMDVEQLGLTHVLNFIDDHG